MILIFRDGNRYDLETSPLICKAHQRTGFYMIGSSVMKELKSFFEYFFFETQIFALV